MQRRRESITMLNDIISEMIGRARKSVAAVECNSVLISDVKFALQL